MTLLSLIVPVYRVEKYLARCLDSILTQEFTDYEVIVVDDASDDGCPAILARYAERHPRLRVVALTRNQGLSAARNAGIAVATGRYVWCVDSDDWLPEGALTAVAARLVQTDPDLLVTGYARVYDDGRVEHHGVASLTAHQPVTQVFTAREQPGVLRLLWLACNKIVRRRFLLRTGLTFAPGWYEDLSLIVPLTLAAERISVLDHYCYAYRQRADGAITRTRSGQHFQVFEQWQRVFAFLAAAQGRYEEFRPLIFHRMIWHCLQVLGHPHRVPAERRREFFARITEHYHRYLPPGGAPMPRGNEGVKQRLVALGSYPLFAALTAAWQVRKRLAVTGRPGRVPLAAAESTGPDARIHQLSAPRV